MMRKREDGEEGKIDAPQVVLFLIFVLAALALGLFVYWLAFDDNPPAEVNHVQLYENIRDVPVEFIEAVPGSDFVYGLDWCKYTTANVEIRYTWVDELISIEPLQHPTFAEPGCRHVHIPVTVPNTLPPSKYILNVNFEYQVNPLVSRDMSFEVGPIFVIEKE